MRSSRDTNRAMISVIEKARGRRETRPATRILSVVLMAVFFIALMGGLAAGATMYRSAVESQEQANELHLLSGLITNVVRGNDVAQAVSEGAGPEGPSLVLTRAVGERTYETRIYLYEGNVVQEFAVAGREYDPRGATTLLESDTFAFDIDGDLVTFTCDQGSFCVALRSDQATAPAEGGAA